MKSDSKAKHANRHAASIPNGKKKGRMADQQPSDLMFCGASDRNRTRNPLITNQLLYR